MRRTPKAVAGLLGLAVWCGAAGLAAAGIIKGTVRLAGGPVEVTKLKMTVDHNVCGTTKDAEDIVVSPDMGLRNVWSQPRPKTTEHTSSSAPFDVLANSK